MTHELFSFSYTFNYLSKIDTSRVARSLRRHETNKNNRKFELLGSKNLSISEHGRTLTSIFRLEMLHYFHYTYTKYIIDFSRSIVCKSLNNNIQLCDKDSRKLLLQNGEIQVRKKRNTMNSGAGGPQPRKSRIDLFYRYNKS